MTSEDHIRIRSLFDEAAVIEDREARAAYLSRACEDEALRTEVQSLLEAYDEAAELEPFVPNPMAWADPEPLTHSEDRLIGRQIGQYRLVEKIGHGGMGAVYRAVRDDGLFDKTVAVKVIRAGMDSEAILRRFEVEQRILAALEHPYITQLLDGGRTEDGFPFFIMEYVEGGPIDEYCDVKRLDLRQRLRLFLRVCDAVRYAHARLVVHRDLKPGNILVAEDEDGNPVPKLLDFGIAKLLQPKSGGASSDLTTLGNRPATPAYASPEQLRGEPVSTACDVYALGVLLYRLLTGRLPYRLEERSPDAVRRAVFEELPGKPSSVVMRTTTTILHDGTRRTISPEVVSRARSTSQALLRRRLVGDLDTIVLTALRKEPERRYVSAEQFAEDVRRYLEGRPISAQTDSFRYRSAKFVRRNGKIVAAASLVILSLLGGIFATVWQARIAEQERSTAERRFADVRRLTSTFLFEFHDAIRDLPGATPARELVLERALEYLDKLAREAGSDPSLRLELATAYRRVGDVQGNPTNANLGRTHDALESYRKALGILQVAPSSSSEWLMAQGLIYERLADAQAAAGDLDAAHFSAEEAVTRYQRLRREHPSDLHFQVRHAVGLIKHGDLQGNPNFPNRGRRSAALDRYLTARPILEDVYAADSSYERVYRLRGLIDERIGTMRLAMGETGKALEAFLRSMDVREGYAAINPHDQDAVRDLAIAHEKIGRVAAVSGDREEARRRHARATEIFRMLLASDSQNAQAWQSLAISRLHEADLAAHPEDLNSDNLAAAASSYTEALQLLEEIRRIDPANARTGELADRAEAGLAQVDAVAKETQ